MLPRWLIGVRHNIDTSVISPQSVNLTCDRRSSNVPIKERTQVAAAYVSTAKTD